MKMEIINVNDIRNNLNDVNYVEKLTYNLKRLLNYLYAESREDLIKEEIDEIINTLKIDDYNVHMMMEHYAYLHGYIGKVIADYHLYSDEEQKALDPLLDEFKYIDDILDSDNVGHLINSVIIITNKIQATIKGKEELPF